MAIVKTMTDVANERERVGSKVVIYKMPSSPFWYLQFNLHGRQYRSSLGTRSKKEARRMAVQKDAEMVLGQPTLPAPRGPDLERHINAFIEHVRGKDADAKTVVLYTQYLLQFCDWAIAKGIRRLEQANLQTLESYQQALMQGGFSYRAGVKRKEILAKPNKRRTLRNKMKTLRSLQKWALRRAIITKDPGAGYALPPRSKDQAHGGNKRAKGMRVGAGMGCT